MKYCVSIIVPTFNSAAVLEECLQSISLQDYPKDHIEIIIADAGSTDETIAIAKKYTSQIYENPLKTGEAGKAVGIQHASHEILAFIDSDNILPHPQWLTRMTEPFEDPEILASEPLYYTWRKEDHVITRYCALMGMNDPLCYFLGNYDRMNMISKTWTRMPVKETHRSQYIKVEFLSGLTPTIGANGFLIRKSNLQNIAMENYFMDVDIIPMLIKVKGLSNVKIAKVREGIVHLFCQSVALFIKKQRRRIQDYLFFSNQKKREYHWNAISKWRLIYFVGMTVSVLPLFYHVFIGFRRKPDWAWFFHPVACWITLIVYSTAVGRSFFKPTFLYSRMNWGYDK